MLFAHGVFEIRAQKITTRGSGKVSGDAPSSRKAFAMPLLLLFLVGLLFVGFSIPPAHAVASVDGRSSTTAGGADPTSSIAFQMAPTSVLPGGALTWASAAVCTDVPTTCSAAGAGTGNAVPNGYTENLVVQVGNTCTFSTETTVQTVTTTNGRSGGTFAAPTTPGQYCVRVDHPSQRVGPLFVWASADSNAVVITILAQTSIVSAVNPHTVVVGTPAVDQVVLAGGSSPSGTITYTVYTSPCCSGPGTAAGTSTLSGNGAYASPPFTPTAPGTYYWLAIYNGDSRNAGSTNACGSAGSPLEILSVGLASPTTTTAVSNSGSIAIGGSATDTATLSGGFNPTGTMTFKVYGPSDMFCVGSPLFVSMKVVSGNGLYVSDAFAPSSLGTYHWMASYGGDVNNNAVSTGCRDSGESLVVVKASPCLSTAVSPATMTQPAPPPFSSNPTAPPASDAATLSGGYTPTGTITFNVYTAPDCSGESLFTSTVPVSGNGVYTSDAFAAAGAGTYYWQVSFTATDSYDVSVAPSCGGNGETLTISPASPSVSTLVSPQTISLSLFSSTTTPPSAVDNATVSGGFSPTGTITFSVYATPDCSGDSLFTSTSAVSGNGQYSSNPFNPPSAGTYYWQVSFAVTDPNDNLVSTSCAGPGETLTVDPATPSVATLVSPQTMSILGTTSSPTDTATLVGAYLPTGTVTFTVYSDAGCTAVVHVSPPIPISGFTATSDSFAPPSAGTYYWMATYSGDINNIGFSTSCGDSGEALTVNPATPTEATVVTDSTGTAVTSVALGTAVHDTSSLTGAFNPSGTVTYSFFANTACSGPVSGIETVTISGGAIPDSSDQTIGAGSYSYSAHYGGDVNNIAVDSPCEPFSVMQASTATSTAVQPSSSLALGTSAADSATVGTQVAGFTIGGSVTYHFFTNSVCSGTPVDEAVAVGTGSTPQVLPAGSYSYSAQYSGDANYAPSDGSCEPFTVAQAPTAVVTNVENASATVLTGGSGPLGTTAHDTSAVGAQVAGFTISGSVTYHYFANGACSGTTTDQTVTMSVGLVPDSSSYGPLAAGSYSFSADYSGDANYLPSSGGCESFTVSTAPTSTSTQVHDPSHNDITGNSVVVGTTVHDSATVSGQVSGFTIGGTVTYSLFASSACSGTPTSTETVAVGTESSPLALGVGAYGYSTSYSGDSNYLASSGSCEPFTVIKASPAITTAVSSSGTITIGGSASDVATLSGGFNPGGAIGFKVYFNDNTCQPASLVFTSPAVTVAGNGPYTSASFTPLVAGTYYWTASYGGDASNNGAATHCGDAGETLTVQFNGKAANYVVSTNAGSGDNNQDTDGNNEGSDGAISAGQSVEISAQVQDGTPSCAYSVSITVTGPTGNTGPWTLSSTLTTDKGGDGQIQVQFPSAFPNSPNTNTPGGYPVSAVFTCGTLTGSAATGFTVDLKGADYVANADGPEGGLNTGGAVEISAQVQDGTPSCAYSVSITVTGPTGNTGPWTLSSTLTTDENGQGQTQVTFSKTSIPGGYPVFISFACGSSTGSAGTGFTVNAPSFKSNASSGGSGFKVGGTFSVHAQVQGGYSGATYTVKITVTGPSPSSSQTFTTTATLTTDSNGNGDVTVSGIPVGATAGTYTVTAVFQPTAGPPGIASSTFTAS